MTSALGLLLAALDTLQQYAERGAGGVVHGAPERMLSDVFSAICAFLDDGLPLTNNEQHDIVVGYGNIRSEFLRANRARSELSDDFALHMACVYMSRMRETVLKAQSRRNARDA